MLAGILIAVLLIGGLVVAIPWMSEQRADEYEDDATAERFSDSMRIVPVDSIEMGDTGAVSTPLTRAAERQGLRMTAKRAARRRLTVLLTLLGVASVLGLVSAFGWLPWWSALIPVTLSVVFLGIARFTVVEMHRKLDAYAAALDRGFQEQEDTVVIEVEAEETHSTEFSVDLAAPVPQGSFWDPVPVTAPTYVQKPLLPRTVRTIDLSSPVVESMPLVPTADRPDAEAEESRPLSFRRVAGQ